LSARNAGRIAGRGVSVKHGPPGASACCAGRGVFKGSAHDRKRLIERVRSGLPYSSLEALASRFQIGQRELVAVLDLPLRTLSRRKRASAVVPVERNYLINPVHPQSHQVRVGKAEAFSLDPRMWK